MIADDLTRQPHPDRALCQKHLFLRNCHPRGFPLDEFDATGCATGIAAAGVQLVDVRVLLEREHQTLSILDIKRSESFYGQPGHVW